MGGRPRGTPTRDVHEGQPSKMLIYSSEFSSPRAMLPDINRSSTSDDGLLFEVFLLLERLLSLAACRSPFYPTRVHEGWSFNGRWYQVQDLD